MSDDIDEGGAPPNKRKRSDVSKNPPYRIPEERFQAARILYESIPGMSFPAVAEQVGVHVNTLEGRSKKDGGWKKCELLPPTQMSETAQAVADKYTGALEEYGPEITDEDKQTVLHEVLTDTANDVRGQLVARHRREWGAIRALVYQGLRTKQYGDLAKLAKISAETLQIVQSNERKAWGLDPKDSAPNTLVIIERGS